MREVEQFELIRRDHESGLSIRDIANKYRIHRRVVRQALRSPMPPARKTPERGSPKLTKEIKGLIDGILLSDKKGPRKQRHTAHRIWQRCVEEMGSGAAESTVREYVSERKRDLGLGLNVFVPQHHPAGAQGEVDIYEALVYIQKDLTKVHIVDVRSEYSAASLHTAYPRATQDAFFEAIELSFEFLGGAFPILRFDNLKAAVARVLTGQRRVEQDRFIAFRSHYLFEASFCTPGLEGAHEKGGVEGDQGRFRRNHLVPIPKVASFEELNSYLKQCCLADLSRRSEGKSMTVGELAEIEREFLKPLPAEPFELAEILRPRVDDESRIKVKNCFYSVPVAYAGRKVEVKVSPRTIEVIYGGKLITTQARLHLKNDFNYVLDHYLELCWRKPGAFPGSMALHQARAKGEFPRSYEAIWGKLKAHLGDKHGTRAMIEILLLHRGYPRQTVVDAVERALVAGAIDPAAVALIARGLAENRGATQLELIDVGELSRYQRPAPELSGYNLLTTTPPTKGPHDEEANSQ